MQNTVIKKSIGFAILTAMISGCAATSNYYILSTASKPSAVYTQHQKTIGIEKVSVPKYLFKREIAIAKSSSEVAFLSDGTWAEDMDEGLTQRLVGFIQKKFNQPQVYEYPWGVDAQPNMKVRVQITRYIAEGNFVYLDANWHIEDLQTHQSKARLFSVKVPTKDDTKSIVAAMDQAFGKFEESIAEGIRRF